MASAEIKSPSLGERGEEVYKRSMQHLVEPQHNNKILVIVVESGDYAFEGDDGWEGIEKMRARHPGKLFYFKRIGSPYMYRFRTPRLLKESDD
jgi:hypothetical protein